MFFSNTLILTTFASAALAVPGHRHVHRPRSYAAHGNDATSSQTSAPFPYPSVNSTLSAGPTGTGLSSYLASSSPLFSTASIQSSLASSSSAAPSVSHPQSKSTGKISSYASSSRSVASPSAPATTSAVPHAVDAAGDDYCVPNDTTSTVTVELYITVDAEDSSITYGSHTSTPTSTSVAPAAVIPSNVVAIPSSHLLQSLLPSTTASSVTQAASSPSSSFQVSSVSSSAPSAIVSVPSVVASSSSSTAPAPSGSYNTGKRGLAYEDASLTHLFAGQSHVSWAYNWGCNSGDLPAGIQYIPTLWGGKELYTNPWNEEAKKAIANGAEYLFSFNEPDMPSQADMSVADAVAAYKQWMQPLAGQAKLGAPSVTNSGDSSQGLAYLSSFLSACDGCQIDFINIHWYAELGNPNWDAAQGFKSHIQDAISRSGGKPVFVTEFGPTDNTHPSDAVINAFLEDVMAWMDAEPSVLGYSYFMVNDGKLLSGSALSSVGNIYATFSP